MPSLEEASPGRHGNSLRQHEIYFVSFLVPTQRVSINHKQIFLTIVNKQLTQKVFDFVLGFAS